MCCSAEKAYLFKERCEHSDAVWKEFGRQLKKKETLKPVQEKSELTVSIKTPVDNKCGTNGDTKQAIGKTETLSPTFHESTELVDNSRANGDTQQTELATSLIFHDKNSEFDTRIQTPVDNKCGTHECQLHDGPKIEISNPKIREEVKSANSIEKVYYPCKLYADPYQHGDLKKFDCNKCKKTFSNKSQLAVHAECHEETESHICQYCGKSFVLSANLKVHIRIHTGEKPYKCDKCGASFAFWPSLHAHKLSYVKEKNFECKECHKRFLRSGTLRKHMYTHTGGQKYPCYLCAQQFKCSQSLKRHILTHSNERPCKCKVCRKGFSRNCNLKVQMKTHTGEKPYFCKMCKKVFTQPHCLHSHSARFHNDTTRTSLGANRVL